ncbi:Shugoshin [Nakaseomyces bracarensis]|uniref:Shugoshin n=1 Tax=Nakaseomyces bracarensis TaxID=273131 RepID=A0ABR4P097_9SACH
MSLFDNETPHIQEIQNILDFEREKLDAIKLNYSNQNSLLAKENSSLKMKLNELESKISQLIKENVHLRSLSAAQKLEYQHKLSDQLQVLENGVVQRFEEVLYMFDSIRKKESLPSTNNENIERIRRKRRSTESRRSRSISSGSSYTSKRRSSTFGDELIDKSINQALDNAKSNSLQTSDTLKLSQLPSIPLIERSQPEHDNLLSPIPRKKRKSDRRKSMFVPDELPVVDTESTETNAVIECEGSKNNASIMLSNRQATDEQDYPEELSENFSNSVIEYSIPEDNILPQPMKPSNLEQFNASKNTEKIKSKLEIFHDEPDTSSSPQSTIENQSNSFISLNNNSKIKHSMKPRKTKKNKGIVDEIMPQTQDSAQNMDFERPRRTRGKTVDYKLPSLRAKMRRPTEKLVDATTTVNIQDLQVKYNKTRRRSQENETKLLNNDSAKIKTEDPKTSSFGNGTIFKNIPASRTNSRPSSGESNISERVDKENENNTSMFDSSHSSINNSNKSVLSDITNTSKARSQKTKKLLKTAIINDIYDEKAKNSSPKTVSFRVKEDDLAVFDLINSDDKSHKIKTYRSKSRQK